ncbi:MAG TPA: xanthine dehydrogenase family protein molybdopterin-binding subunit [Bacillales bacterium]|nr:xanthine dehydrogenase family protein molybdopterin-binding subunit [Bacillales bacterium]
MHAIGRSMPRKDAEEKVTGRARYTDDLKRGDTLHAKMVVSPHAHARIIGIDTSSAQRVPGVHAILTGKNTNVLTGEDIRDRPVLAIEKVRYYFEPVALVIAETEAVAKRAASLVKVTYAPLPIVRDPVQAYKKDAPLIHENLAQYQKNPRVYPVPGTNIANHTKIRKGNMDEGWARSSVSATSHISFGPSDHAAMETRSASAEILPNGHVVIYSSSQVPFTIMELFSEYFGLRENQITVHTPFVGGAYGGKSAVQLEYLVYLASKAVGGRKVKLTNSREEDLVTSPVHIGLNASVKLGCNSEGDLQAAELLFLFDGGAYSGKGTDMNKAAAVDCTGPYAIENVWCDSLCLYTNHPYATSFRGFGHPELTFAVERAMEHLAQKLSMDPAELRKRNAIRRGQTTPTRVVLNKSKIGNTEQCIERVKTLIDWEKGQRFEAGPHLIRAKGMSCFWKTSNVDTNAGSGAILLFNEDGTVNLSCGVSEIGTGTRSVLTQIAAERLKIDPKHIFVEMNVDTSLAPEHFKTVASRGMWMAGRAVLEAADDAIHQLLWVAAQVFRAPVADLGIADGFVFLKNTPEQRLPFSEIAHGYVYPNGNGIGAQVIGRGSYSLQGMTYLDPETGEGVPGPDWTVGAQAVEVEWNSRDYTYRILRAVTAIDAGTIINPKLAKGQVMGAMSMGLSFASREGFIFNQVGQVINHRLRTYKVLRYGENPGYTVSFVVTPSRETAYGLRGIGEMGVIGMPAALANSLSLASGVSLNHLPLTPELIWRLKTGGRP